MLVAELELLPEEPFDELDELELLDELVAAAVSFLPSLAPDESELDESELDEPDAELEVALERESFR